MTHANLSRSGYEIIVDEVECATTPYSSVPSFVAALIALV